MKLQTRSPQRPSPQTRAPRRAHRGFTLLAILIMMVVLALLALAGVTTSVVQEKMAGNVRDRNVALQAAEAALRDAEQDVLANLDAAAGFGDACGNGLCLPPSMVASGAQSEPKWKSLDWATQARAYGSVTGAAALRGPNNDALASQPRYFIELLPSLPPDPGESACQGCNVAPNHARAYRITVRATGVRDSTVVMLQSVYVKQ